MRDLPGDGLAGTPDFDTDDRQPIQNRPNRLIDVINDAMNNPRPAVPVPDAGAADAGGDASDASGPP